MILATEADEQTYTIDLADRIERRNHSRIQVIGAVDGILAGPDFTKWVQIMDISRGGLSFCYAATHRLQKGSFELDVLSDHQDLALHNVKIKVLSDIHIGRELFLGFVPIRRCSAKFTDLTVDQKRELDHFVKNAGSDDTSQNMLPLFSDKGSPLRGWV